ncbi:MAG: hypothetical protein WA055_04965 [Candidatus Moraniibacteriota bacterium]
MEILEKRIIKMRNEFKQIQRDVEKNSMPFGLKPQTVVKIAIVCATLSFIFLLLSKCFSLFSFTVWMITIISLLYISALILSIHVIRSCRFNGIIHRSTLQIFLNTDQERALELYGYDLARLFFYSNFDESDLQKSRNERNAFVAVKKLKMFEKKPFYSFLRIISLILPLFLATLFGAFVAAYSGVINIEPGFHSLPIILENKGGRAIAILFFIVIFIASSIVMQVIRITSLREKILRDFFKFYPEHKHLQKEVNKQY